jgi:hypothetical protein
MLHRVTTAPRLLLTLPLMLAPLAVSLLVPSNAARAATTGTLSATYDGYAHGVIALRLTASFDFTPSGYSGRLEFHTAGMLGWVNHTESDSQVAGRFTATTPPMAAPTRYDSTGLLHGTQRVTHMTYKDGMPVIEAQSPPAEQERTPVPPAQTAHALDTLSAIALLIRQAGATGKCDGSVTAFDGRRLTALVAHTAGDATLPPERKFNFDGNTLRCDFVGTQLAGFIKTQDEAQLRRPRHGTAWLAPLVPGAPPVPVKVMFEHQALGMVTMYLTSVSGSSGAVAQNR